MYSVGISMVERFSTECRTIKNKKRWKLSVTTGDTFKRRG